MNFLIQLAWMILVSYVTKKFLTPEPPRQADARRQGIEDVNAPTISEATAVPLVFGRVKTTQQNVSWYGGLSSVAIVKEKVTVGFKYFLSAQYTLCLGPIDDIQGLSVDGTDVNPSLYTKTDGGDYIDFNINAPNLLGGEDQGGGVSGILRVYKGTPTQARDLYLAQVTGTEIPAFRRIAYAVSQNMYMGTSVTLRPLTFTIDHCVNSLGVTEGKHRIGDDSNPVCVLYYLMSETIDCAGEPVASFDLAAWRAAADVLYSEGIGISLSIASPADLSQHVQDLLKYIDGAVFEDPVTGLISLKLIRDAVGDSPPIFDKTNISAIDMTRLSWTELHNTVKVTYTDRARQGEKGGVMAQNSAAVRALGGAVDLTTIDLPGLTSGTSAMLVAERALRAYSYPLSKVQVTGDRALAALVPGEAFRLQWDHPPVNAIFRVAKVDLGGPDTTAVTVTALEDVYSADSNTFTPAPPGGWVAEDATPRPVTAALLIEAPYFLAPRATRNVIFGPQAPTRAHTGFTTIVLGDASDPTVYPFAVAAPLPAAMPMWSGAVLSSLTLALSLPDDLMSPTAADHDAGRTLLAVGDELLAYRAVTRNGDGTTTFLDVERAVLDTVPVPHSAGEPVYVLATAAVREDLAATIDVTAELGARTITSAGSQPKLEATRFSLVTANRAGKPPAPALVAVNGVPYASGAVAFPAEVTWAPRPAQPDRVYPHDTTGLSADSGTDYYLQVFNLTTESSYDLFPAGTSVTLVDHGHVIVTIVARRGGLLSRWGAQLNFTIA